MDWVVVCDRDNHVWLFLRHLCRCNPSLHHRPIHGEQFDIEVAFVMLLGCISALWRVLGLVQPGQNSQFSVRALTAKNHTHVLAEPNCIPVDLTVGFSVMFDEWYLGSCTQQMKVACVEESRPVINLGCYGLDHIRLFVLYPIRSRCSTHQATQWRHTNPTWVWILRLCNARCPYLRAKTLNPKHGRSFVHDCDTNFNIACFSTVGHDPLRIAQITWLDTRCCHWWCWCNMISKPHCEQTCACMGACQSVTHISLESVCIYVSMTPICFWNVPCHFTQSALLYHARAKLGMLTPADIKVRDFETDYGCTHGW